MNESIRISAVIPAYNRAKTIGRAIDSVLAQEFPACEIIVVDDGSKDNTKEIVKRYGEKIHYVYQNNAGVAVARNRGVYEAKYEWIAFLDSDDYWLPQHLKRTIEVIRFTEEKAALYFSDIMRPIDEGGGTYWELSEFSVSGRFEFRRDASEWALGLRRQPMMLQVSVIKREKYLEIGGIPEALITREDTFLFYKICLFYPACAVAGCGGGMSSDCKESGRLTAEYDSRTFKFHECTILLYKELMKDKNKMRYDNRKIIKIDFVGAYLDYGNLLIKRKKFIAAILNIIEGAKINPAILTALMIRKIKLYLFKKYFSCCANKPIE
jgi:glycosyltransferase involved in cell wall biosynthesis